jgi:hypothetical protein
MAGAGQPAELQWRPDWPRFRTAEALFTGALLVPIAGAVFVYPHPKANWAASCSTTQLATRWCCTTRANEGVRRA